ncbi:TetR/AcrR family transcriptional regulator [Burkholderia sp. A1]|uniref:TetR/AcrR family transcriptional regulator n=1 Tax=Burkholderia sp. A1 TaxID=148446 RepID=UPI000469B11E|nr:TetR/AcrR family transcriptional regulator [Burkholderia sp. A1]
MRYSREHKEESRRRLLASSGRHAKKNGFSASGVDALAASAGVTIGSLYKHFGTKNALFASIVEMEIGRTIAWFESLRERGAPALSKVLTSYASMDHLRQPAEGCMLPALSAEVARSSDEVRAAFEAGMLSLKSIMSELAGSDQAAWVLIAQNVGAVMIARAMLDEDRQRELLNAVQAANRDLIEAAPAAPAPTQAD